MRAFYLQSLFKNLRISCFFRIPFAHSNVFNYYIFQGLNSEWESTVQCLDILLRWFTLRFYDKNTTVHIKCLEYLKALFEKLDQTDYRATDYELSSFLPHLITKVSCSSLMFVTNHV